jgi:hypothetical protein
MTRVRVLELSDRSFTGSLGSNSWVEFRSRYFGGDDGVLVILLANRIKQRQHHDMKRQKLVRQIISGEGRAIMETPMAVIKSLKELVQRRVASDAASRHTAASTIRCCDRGMGCG